MIVSALAEAGFDVVQPFDAARHGFVDPARRLGLLVGNTRALWPKFLAARLADPELAASPDPLERYTEHAIERASPDATRWFSHRRYDGRYVPVQQLAVAIGLGALAPTQLVIHPVYGPWLALRAVLLVDGEPPTPAPPVSPCTCGAPCLAAFEHARAATGPEAWRAWLAVRDACPVGRAWRYGDDQLAYHYTKNRGLLG